MDTASRLKNLEAWKIKKDIEESAKQQIEEERVAKLVADIEALWPRAQELITLYNAGVDMGLPFPKSDDYSLDKTFVSNSVSHKLGFGRYAAEGPGRYDVVRSPYVNAISIRGGGACNFEIDLCDGKLHYSGSSAMRQLDGGGYSRNAFIPRFEKFEERFLAWFDEITG
jgi:hypothetical protein